MMTCLRLVVVLSAAGVFSQVYGMITQGSGDLHGLWWSYGVLGVLGPLCLYFSVIVRVNNFLPLRDMNAEKLKKNKDEDDAQNSSRLGSV
jgi:hypothetical protein